MLTSFGKQSGHPSRLIDARAVKAVKVDYADKDSTAARRMKGLKSSWRDELCGKGAETLSRRSRREETLIFHGILI